MRNNKFLLTGVFFLVFFFSAEPLAAQTDFQAFWKNFKAAVSKGDKAKVAAMSDFPVFMPAFQKQVRTRTDFLRRYDSIFSGEADAARCFAKAKPEKRDAKTFEVFCPFKQTPDDWTNAPISYTFILTKNGWKFGGLDNINE